MASPAPIQNFGAAMLVVLGAYILYSQPLAVAFVTFGLSAMLYGITKSLELVLFIFIASIFLKGFNSLMMPPTSTPAPAAKAPTSMPAAAPAAMEGFQARDPVSVQKRLESVHGQAPLAPKVVNVTGVLESPSILDNVALQPYQELMSDAVPGASIPASAKARVAIYTPVESFVPVPAGSVERQPMENPYLQEGQDQAGLETALIEKGTEMQGGMDGANAASMSVGSAPAF